MNEIDNLTDQEKSVMLARVSGWEVSKLGQIFPKKFPGSDIAIYSEDSLYNPRHMALAWHVAEWAWDFPPTLTVKQGQNNKSVQHVFRVFWATKMRPIKNRKCQRLWLDKILELAIQLIFLEDKISYLLMVNQYYTDVPCYFFLKQKET